MKSSPELSDSSALALVDRPQRLGILPTWSFWKQVPERVKQPIVYTGFTVTLGTVLFSGFSGPLVGGIAGVGGMLLSLGLVEKYIRHQVAKRRERAAALENLIDCERRAM